MRRTFQLLTLLTVCALAALGPLMFARTVPARAFVNLIHISRSPASDAVTCVIQRTGNLASGWWQDEYFFNGADTNITSWSDTNEQPLAFYRLGNYGPAFSITNH